MFENGIHCVIWCDAVTGRGKSITMCNHKNENLASEK